MGSYTNCFEYEKTVTDTPLDGRPSVDSTSSSSHRSIARYRLTIVLIAADCRSVYNMQKPDIGSESRLLPTPPRSPAFDAQLGGSRRNIAMPFGMVKLEWLGYPMMIRLFVLT